MAAAAVLLGGCIALTDFHECDTSRSVPDGGGGPVEASGIPTIAPLPSVVVRRGLSVAVAVTIDRHGTTGPIHVDASALPEGVSVVPVEIQPEASVATISLVTTAAAPLGPLTVLVRATATGSGVSVNGLFTLTITSTQLDPTFGDGGFVVGGPEEIPKDFVTDDAGVGFAAVDATNTLDGDAGSFRIYRLDGSGGVGTLLRLDDGSLDHRATLCANGRLAIVSARPGDRTIAAYELSTGQIGWSAALDDENALGAWPIAAPDGSVFVLSGGRDPATGSSAVFLRHISAAGTADPAFGASGTVLPLRATTVERPGGAVFTSRGLIVCTTRAYPDATLEIVLRRMTDAGGIDTAFGAAGEVAVRPGGNASAKCTDVVVDGNTLIVAVNLGADGVPAAARAALLAVDLDGVVDRSFGDGGVTDHPSVGTASVASAAVSRDGAGLYSAVTDDRGALVLRDQADGREDRSFGTGDGGAFSAAFGASSSTASVRVLPDGRLLVAGTTKLRDGITWYVARVLP
jgi:hypothetical protein